MSDRQITKEGGLKYYEKKTWYFSAMHFTIASAYVGSPDLAGAFNFELKRILPPETSESMLLDAEIKELVETALAKVWRKHRRNWDLQMLIGYQQRDYTECAVWRSSGKTLVSSDLDCIGVGDSSVIRFLFDTFGQGHSLEVKQFMPLGLYAMMQAKKYISGCGGKTDITVLRRGRSILPGGGLAPRQRETEEELEFLEEQIVRLCQFYSESSPDGFATILSDFAEQVGKRQPHANLMRLGYL
jgi:hypothetical protein